MDEGLPAHERVQATHAALEAHAIRLVGQNGLEATTVAAIAEAAGVTERTFFRYFASKHEAILGYVVERLTGVVAELGNHCGDRVTIECLLRACRALAAVLAGDDEFVGRMRLVNSDRRLREELQVERSRIGDLLSAEIARHEGAKPGLRSDALAKTAFAVVSAGTDAWIEDPASSRSVEQCIDHAARAVLEGDA